MLKQDLIEFEQDVARLYAAGKIIAPVHLSGGNEDKLIEIFRDIHAEDWVLATWRSHYAALLKGIPREEIMRQILAGKSMSINSFEHRFYSSSIAGGILPIAVGLGLAIQRKGENRRAWCFVGDMTAEMGVFHEALKYVSNFDLPVTFIVESNHKSVLTVTAEAWGRETLDFSSSKIIRYEYELTYPHHGAGKSGAAF